MCSKKACIIQLRDGAISMTAVVDLQQAIHGVKGRHYFLCSWVNYFSFLTLLFSPFSSVFVQDEGVQIYYIPTMNGYIHCLSSHVTISSGDLEEI